MTERFERYELKYRLTLAQYERLMAALQPHLIPDRYPHSVIGSLYYDTPDRRLIRQSLEKPIYKEKLRVRSYGAVSSGDRVFVELKKKYDHIVYKRRIAMTANEANVFLANGACQQTDTQVAREIAYFCTQYPSLQPAMLLIYDREAYITKEDPQLRITFDHRVRFREHDLQLGDLERGTLLLPDECLLEVKTANALPFWLLRLLEEEHLYRSSFSKYGTAFLTAHPSQTTGGMV